MITQSQLKEIIRRIAQSCDPERILLFGSYASGHPNQNSDVDLLVIVRNSKLPIYKRGRAIRKQLWGITDVPKDILVYTQQEIEGWKMVEEAFITSAIKTGKVLYER
jgi:uncharacterized protein